jgi:ABC transport system ATP-binding/permease protein
VAKVSHQLVLVGLENIASEHVSTLALPQRRRLKLALALVSDPVLVLCDDFTAGLDVRSEREMEALLKLAAVDVPQRIVIHATDSLANLAAYDTALVLHEGYVTYHGPAKAIPHYFTVPTYDEVYSRLAKRPAQRWGDSWMRHRDSYYAAFKLGDSAEQLSAAEEEPGTEDQTVMVKQKVIENEGEDTKASAAGKEAPPVLPLPGLFFQAKHLLQRRWSILRRRPREWGLHLSLLIGSPLLAWLLALSSLPHLRALAETTSEAPTAEALYPAAHTAAMIHLVQILLILFMALRLSSREIASQRVTHERETVSGVRPSAILLAALLFVLPVSLLQSLGMGFFLEIVSGGLPGNGGMRLLLPALTGMAFASLCLGISALSRTPGRAHSLSLTLLFANVLLCGALLGFPRLLGQLVHPFITAHYGWSGILDTLHDDALFQPLTRLVHTWFATPTLALGMLSLHLVIGIVLAWLGLRRRER